MPVLVNDCLAFDSNLIRGLEPASSNGMDPAQIRDPELLALMARAEELGVPDAPAVSDSVSRLHPHEHWKCQVFNELLGFLKPSITPRKSDCGTFAGQGRLLWNHAKAILACDFFVAVTATFRLLYVFMVIEHGSRRLVRVDVMAHPSAGWTLQQLREVVGFGNGNGHRYLIHDRDSIFAKYMDDSIKAQGLSVLKSPSRSPKANAICERVIGTIRRGCLDWLIPISEAHLRAILKYWVEHYHRGRPHSSLGPGVTAPPDQTTKLKNWNPAIGSGPASLWTRNQFWEGCITNIAWHPLERDRM